MPLYVRPEGMIEQDLARSEGGLHASEKARFIDHIARPRPGAKREREREREKEREREGETGDVRAEGYPHPRPFVRS